MINISVAKADFSRLVERAARGESFVIMKGGQPLAKLVPLTAEDRKKPRRLGFLAGQFQVPDDFDAMGRDEIEAQFCGKAKQ